MKRTLERLRQSAASLTVAGGLLMLLLAGTAGAQPNYCNNPVPPCNPNEVGSPCYTPPEDDKKCEPEIPCEKCRRSPCYVGTGGYASEVTDLLIRTNGFPISVERMYRSTHRIDGASGYGWVSGLSARLHYAVYLKSAPDVYQREVQVRIPDGNLYRFVENGNGTYTPPQGRFDTLVRNGDGTWDLWLQRTRSRLRYSATGSLLQMIDDYGNTLTWTYTNDRLTRVADSSGSTRYIDITYGADGRISDVTDMTGRNVHYAYDANGVLTSVTNPAGQSTAYSYVNGKYVKLLNGITDHWGRVVTSVVYDLQDRVASYTDAGETYTYTYNYNGSATTTAKTDSSGNVWVYPFGSGGLVTENRPPGGAPISTDTYDANGLPILHTDQVGVKTHYSHNARGNPLTITTDYQGPTAVEWRYVYDANFPDQLVSVKPYDPSTNQIHPHWQGGRFEYYPAGSAAPGALHRSYTLDDDGTTSRLTATYTYDTQGRILTLVDAAGNETEYTYDAAGNIATVERPANNDAGTRPVLAYGYDALGRLTSMTDPLGHVTTTTYDVLDRVKTVTLPKPTPSSTLTFTTTWYYDEYDAATQLLFDRIVDPNGGVTKTAADAWGQMLRTVDQAGNVTRNVYVKGLLTERIDANNYSVTYGYDARRRRTTTTYPDGTNELTTYNADDTVASQRDRANQTITFTYDRHKRVVTKGYPNGGAITRSYQGQKLAQVSDSFASPAETHTFVYDAAFRMISETQGSRGTVTRTYDSAGRPATVAVSGGATTTYGYYPDGNVRTLTWSLVAGNFKYDHALSGQLQSITMPNGQTRTYSYDDQGRPTQTANVHPTAGTLATFAYGYDVDPFTGQPTMLGQTASVTATVPSLSLSSAVTRFGYDSRYQLTQAVYPSGTPYNGLSQAWTYDALGNRLSATENGTTANYAYYKVGSNPLNTARLQSDGSNSYTYDAKGNTLSRGGTRGNFTFSYDYDNRIRSVNGDQTAGYLYDFAGRRALKTVAGVQTTYVYDGFQAIAENGAAAVSYLFGPAIDHALAVYQSGQISYYSVDLLGSPVVVSDTAGAVQNSYAWDAFGSARAQNVTVANPFVYTARESAEAGLLYYRFRQYEPAAARFHSEDPTGYDGGDNLYAYVDNAPVAQVDAMGLHPNNPCCKEWDVEGEPWYDYGKTWRHNVGKKRGPANKILFYVKCPEDKPNLVSWHLTSAGPPPWSPKDRHPWPNWNVTPKRPVRRLGHTYMLAVWVPSETVLRQPWTDAGLERVRLHVKCCK